MKVEWMRKVDRHIGRPIAYLFSLFTKSQDVIPDENIETIVVSKYFGIGSITLSTPLMQSLREKFPKAKIIFLTFQQNAELLALFPFIEEVITIRNDNLTNFISDTLKTILRFRSNSKIDLFIDMEFFSHYSALMAWFSGSKFRVGYHTSLLPRGKLLTHRVTFNPHRYITDAFRALGHKIGAEKEHKLYKLQIHSSYIHRVKEWLNKRGLREREYVIINTHGSDHLGELKQWLPERWTDLVTQLVESLQLTVVLTGVTKNLADIERIVEPLPIHVKKYVYNTTGQFSLGEFLALLGKARFVVTIDSGPLHLAQSFRIPCVALFGPETPVTYGPRGKNNRIVYLSLYCSPCCNVLEGKKAECTNQVYNQCMRDIKVEDVWREVVDLHNNLPREKS